MKLTFEDSKYEGPISITGYNKLIELDKVDIVFAWGTTPSAVIAPIAEYKQLPVIVMTGDKDIVKNKKYSIDFSNELEVYSKSQLEELRKRGHKKIAVVKTEIQYLETLIKGLKENLKEGEFIEVIDSFTPGQSVNFQSSLTKLKLKLKQGKLDALGVYLMNGQLSSFYQKMNDHNIKIYSFGSDFFDSSYEKIQSGSSMVGASWSSPAVGDKFAKTYESKFKTRDKVGYAAGFYNFLSLLNDLFSEDYKNNKKLTPEEILSRIESVKERDGVSGKYYFTRDNPEGDPVGGKRFKFPIVIKEVTEGGGERVIKSGG